MIGLARFTGAMRCSPDDDRLLRRSRVGGVHPPAPARPARFSTTSGRCTSSCTTSTPGGSGWPRAWPGSPSQRHGADAEVRADRRSSRGAGRCRLRRQHGQRRRPRRHGDRLRGPGALRRAPDDRRHARRRRRVPRAAHLPGARRASPRDMAAVCPRRLAAQLHQPDGDEHPVPRRARIRSCKVARPLPLGLLDRARPLRAGRRAAGRGRLPQRRRQPPGLGAAVGARRREPLPAARRSASRPTRELRRRVRVDMYRRLGYYPTETSEHSSEYVPWYLHDDAEIDRLRIPVDDYLGISADNVAEYRAPEPRGRPPASTSSPRRRPPSTHRRSSTAWSPARRGRSRQPCRTAA